MKVLVTYYSETGNTEKLAQVYTMALKRRKRNSSNSMKSLV